MSPAALVGATGSPRPGRPWLGIGIALLLFGGVILGICRFGAAQAQLWAAVPRFGVDQQNSRRITDALEDTGFPFQKVWTQDLGGKVESQPIICGGRIYVQAGNRLVCLEMSGEIRGVSPVLSDSPLPSGSSPTYAYTIHGPRIYQATRDHRLWALDPETLAPLWQEEGYLILSAGGRPDMHYRVTASPLVTNYEGKTLVALGTAHGDQTGRSGQYEDNGFFVLEDEGARGKVVYCRQAKGEVTGTPLLADGQIIATQNILAAGATEENLLICYDLAAGREVEDAPRTPQGIPGSPAAEGKRLYLADRQGRLYCYEKDGGGKFQLLWDTPPPGGGSHYNLNSPTLGSRYVYLPVRQYQGGGGLLMAVEKSSGQVAGSLAFDSLLCANLVFWQPVGSTQTFLLVYEASGKTQLLDGESLAPVAGFMDEAGEIHQSLMLPYAPTGLKAPEPIIGENYLLLVDGQGTMHAYIGRGPALVPEDMLDLAITAFQVPPELPPQTAALWQATIRNNTDQPVAGAEILWLEEGSVIHRQEQDFAPWEEVKVRLPWPGKDRPGVIRAEVQVLPPAPWEDSKEDDNVRWDYITIKPPRQDKVSCAEVQEKGSWTVTYPVLIGYRTRTSTSCWSLPEGGQHCTTSSYTDYSSPIYRYDVVGYQESLAATLTVYTGQGRLPDPARPAAEDQDGRGAWEIIPYAAARGWEPHQVTRAGAGFTLQVETVYSTDWETQVPAGAAAIGGTLSGPTKVTAEFYDTRGKLAKVLALEKTSGGDKGKAVWQLPMASHIYQDGATAHKRWFFTGVDIPDGEYQVLVRVSGAGLHDLHTCKTAVVRIYGSIYDDVYEGLRKK